MILINQLQYKVEKTTYESEEKVCELLIGVCELDINEFLRDTFAGRDDPSTLERVDFVDEADGLLSSLADGKELFIVAHSHSCYALSTLHA